MCQKLALWHLVTAPGGKAAAPPGIATGPPREENFLSRTLERGLPENNLLGDTAIGGAQELDDI